MTSHRPPKSDHALQRDVLAELDWDPFIVHEHIGVSANKGVITLTGFVGSYPEKLAAGRAAGNVAGVRGVANELEVRFASDPKTSDDEIAGRIADLFAWDALIPADSLNVTVQEGWVTLAGTVRWNYEREAARKAAGKIGGVRGISCEVTVRNAASAEDVRERIFAAFRRSAAIDARKITVVTDENTVRLGGQVSAWHQRGIAERAAWAAPGVTQIEDNIIVA